MDAPPGWNANVAHGMTARHSRLETKPSRQLHLPVKQSPSAYRQNSAQNVKRVTLTSCLALNRVCLPRGDPRTRLLELGTRAGLSLSRRGRRKTPSKIMKSLRCTANRGRRCGW
ncbi:hypothetical protein BaRGS_00030787 [Batillaria attramentaria]|uniref:Uncharacterized protein n=1 Tax=Batillaria attramentaria TaxID=370345 RepID=A0ABD0JTX2_9CAEN